MSILEGRVFCSHSCGQKSAAARAKKEAKMKKTGSKVSVKYDKSAQKAQNGFKCTVCMQTFIITAKERTLKEHVTAKHGGKKNSRTFEECFPNFGATSAAKGQPANKAEPKTLLKSELKALRKKNKSKRYKGSS